MDVLIWLAMDVLIWLAMDADRGITGCVDQIDRSGAIPMLRIQNRDSYEKTKTREYDDQAMKYLAYVLYPLILCYSAYSLYHNDHKSWCGRQPWFTATLPVTLFEGFTVNNNDKHADAGITDSFTRLRVLLVLNDRGILAQSN
jgi:hypothetical protein